MMESQLMSEIKDAKSKLDKSSNETTNVTTAATTKSNTPAAMLVSELFESFKAKTSSGKPPTSSNVAEPESVKPEIDFKVNLRKVKKPMDTSKDDNNDDSAKGYQIDFKSNLKKTSDTISSSTGTKLSSSTEVDTNIVDFKVKLKKPNAKTEISKEESSSTEPMDFKARLRKVSGPKCQSPTKEQSEQQSKSVVEKRDSITSTESNDAALEDKRKSTGSISSLRKMWESSPKPLRSTHPPTDLDKTTTPTSDDSLDKQSTVKFEKRVWPPVPNTETEKPMVPVKPTVKPPAPTTKPPPPKEPMVKPPPKPAMAVKPNVCNIYAAPTVATTRSAASAKPPVASRFVNIYSILKNSHKP